MDGIKTQGRGVHSPRCAVTVTEAGVHIRTDDDLNPEFWTDVFMPAELVFKLADMITQSRREALEGKK